MTTPEEIRKIGEEIGQVLLSGVSKQFDELKRDLPQIIKSSVRLEFDHVGIDVSEPYRRREEFKFLSEHMQRWNERGEDILKVADSYIADQETKKNTNQFVRNRIIMAIVFACLVAVAGYFFKVDIKGYF